LTVDVDPGHAAAAIGNLTELCAAFQLHFLFDPAQKWCHLAEFVKTKQTVGEKSEEFIRRAQEEGIKARANEEQILNTIIRGISPIHPVECVKPRHRTWCNRTCFGQEVVTRSKVVSARYASQRRYSQVAEAD